MNLKSGSFFILVHEFFQHSDHLVDLANFEFEGSSDLSKRLAFAVKLPNPQFTHVFEGMTMKELPCFFVVEGLRLDSLSLLLLEVVGVPDFEESVFSVFDIFEAGFFELFIPFSLQALELV